MLIAVVEVIAGVDLVLVCGCAGAVDSSTCRDDEQPC